MGSRPSSSDAKRVPGVFGRSIWMIRSGINAQSWPVLLNCYPLLRNIGMGEREYEMGASELEVLRVLWDAGPATVRDVMRCLEDKGRRLAYTTVLTFLTRLEKKGYVASDKGGLAYVYRAKLTRERVRKSRIRSMLSQLYDGAAGPLVLQLVRMEQLRPEELRELATLIETLDGDDDEGNQVERKGMKPSSRGKESGDERS